MGSELFPGRRLADLTRELSAIFALTFEDHDETTLARWLYDHCYTSSVLVPASDAVASEDDNLLTDLIEANHGSPGWEEGWQIDQALAKGRLLARKNGGLRTFAPGEYVTSRGLGYGPESEGPVMVFRVNESRTLQSSYYYAFGETICPFEEETGMLRFYWNIGPQDAPKLMAWVTRRLNLFQIPFLIKFPKRRASYSRRDTVVLYIHRWFYPIAALVLETVYQQVAEYLRSDTPLFTRELLPGLGFAEDPGESFGNHRCRLLARALLLHSTGNSSNPMLALEETFRQQSLSLAHPWLNDAASHDYQFPFISA